MSGFHLTSRARPRANIFSCRKNGWDPGSWGPEVSEPPGGPPTPAVGDRGSPPGTPPPPPTPTPSPPPRGVLSPGARARGKGEAAQEGPAATRHGGSRQKPRKEPVVLPQAGGGAKTGKMPPKK